MLISRPDPGVLTYLPLTLWTLEGVKHQWLCEICCGLSCSSTAGVEGDLRFVRFANSEARRKNTRQDCLVHFLLLCKRNT